MAEIIEPLVSATTHPELQDPTSPRPPKRRQSPSSYLDPSTKRARLSHDPEDSTTSPGTIRASPHTSPTAADPESSSIQRAPAPNPSIAQSRTPQDQEENQDRRESKVQEERKRGQRLFGGLLSTLSQSVPASTQKRRQEIERRQLEKARLQKVEDEKKRLDRVARLKETRLRQQVVWDEEGMRLRHANMRSMANSLCTETKPKLFYKPWELLPADAERIKIQIADTEAQIALNERDFRAHHGQEADLDSHSPAGRTQASEMEDKTRAVGEHRIESSSLSPAAVVPHPENTNEDGNTVNASGSTEAELRAADLQSTPVPVDPGEGELVVGEEDTVIY